MDCRFCQKSFSKGEHLRRHERSHTGSRPFVCRNCKRSFARQDALVRHERLHTRKEDDQSTASPASTHQQSSISAPNSVSTLSGNEDNRRPYGGRQDLVFMSDQSTASSSTHEMQISPDLDFTLVWPDSEDLFADIMSSSSDSTAQWQIPPGTLPLLPCSHQPNSISSGMRSSQDHGSSALAIASSDSHQAVHNVSEMVSSLSSNVTAAVDATSLSSVFLDECLHMFFLRFIPTFPVLHRATFVFRECSQPLLLNAMAIGSLYLGPKNSVVKGEALWRLAHVAVATSWEVLITHRGPHDPCQGVQLILTALLAQVYGALSRNRNIRILSQAFHALSFFWSSQCNLPDDEQHTSNDLPQSTASNAQKDHCWKVWVAKEIRQRALLGHYVLDGLISQMSGGVASVRHAANQLELPSSEAAFEARTADEWLAQVRSEKPQQCTFRSIIRSLFLPLGHPHMIPSTVSAFSLRVVLEGIQSLTSDCDNDSISAMGVPSKIDLQRALSQVYDSIAMSSQLSSVERLETYLRWHTICLDACKDSSTLCRSVCSRFGIAQNVWGNAKSRKPELDLVSWPSTESARRALLHAIAIQETIERLPRGRAHVIHIPNSLFASVTVYCVFTLAGLTSVNIPTVVDWRTVLSSTEDRHSVSSEMPSSVPEYETQQYLRGEYSSMASSSGATKNLLYELNSMQKLFRCLFAQWGIAYDMEDILDQWVTLCH